VPAYGSRMTRSVNTDLRTTCTMYSSLLRYVSFDAPGESGVSKVAVLQ
jgi:hypothetical protein